MRSLLFEFLNFGKKPRNYLVMTRAISQTLLL